MCGKAACHLVAVLSDPWTLSGQFEVLRRTTRMVGAVAAAFCWLGGVALLIHGWVGWWAELEASAAVPLS